jgi:hypothetical protein
MEAGLDLGDLKNLEIKTYWKDEARDFTPWLAKPGNIEKLAQVLRIDKIAVDGIEVPVGGLRADIVAKASNGQKIIIENQLEISDSDHLGRMLAYASGEDASIIIWICSEIRDEYRKVIDWLNNNINQAISFFALKIQLLQIDDSKPAPKFKIICAPREWTGINTPSSELRETESSQLKFWIKFHSYLKASKTKLSFANPGARNWFVINMGKQNIHIECIVNIQNQYIRCNLVLDKDLFVRLYSHKEDITNDLGFPFTWDDSLLDTEQKSVSIINQNDDIVLSETDDLEPAFKWFMETAQKYKEVIPAYY